MPIVCNLAQARLDETDLHLLVQRPPSKEPIMVGLTQQGEVER
ncbi:hypothetical protein SynMITS9220_02968 [Synechococcus sp. MIT S9220]|nr:hypothetical protein SynMITS9220_02968 [Synechococcus sp. MIT S9220]